MSAETELLEIPRELRVRPVRGQLVRWCSCGDWFQSKKDERRHLDQSPGHQLGPVVDCEGREVQP